MVFRLWGDEGFIDDRDRSVTVESHAGGGIYRLGHAVFEDDGPETRRHVDDLGFPSIEDLTQGFRVG